MEKDVKNYEGIYKVSNMGVIIPVKPRNKYAKTLKPATDRGGYQIVSLVKDKVKHTKTVHRIVAEAFLGSSHLDINHINGNKADNRLENLEYCTKSDNIKHGIKMGLITPNYTKIAVLKRKPVEQIDTKGNVINEFISAHEASRRTGYGRGNISNACRMGLIRYGYKWRYKNEITY
jgi:hypothetical protein